MTRCSPTLKAVRMDYGVVYHGVRKNVEEKGQTQEGLQNEGVDRVVPSLQWLHSAYVRRKANRK